MILAHTCCTTCALNLIQSVQKMPDYANEPITLYYYNPNIHPQTEWQARRLALKNMVEKAGYSVIVADWTPRDFFNRIKPLLARSDWLEDKTKRCPLCWSLRLEKTFQYAKVHQFTAVTTTMLTSPYLNPLQIEAIGNILSKHYQLPFIVPKNLVCSTCTKGYFAQSYCGCVYSLEERLREKYFNIDKKGKLITTETTSP